MNWFFATILLFVSTAGFSQETIDEMFDDGLIHDYKINPSIDVARLFAGTPNINLELLLINSISITTGVGFTKKFKLNTFSEVLDGAPPYETNIKNGSFIHFLGKYFYGERNQLKGYFGGGYNLHKITLIPDEIYSSHNYKKRHIHLGGGVQWHGARNITYDYYLGVGFSNKTANSIKIGETYINVDETLDGGFVLCFKIGYPIK